jgi:DNA repair protein RecN (Recombination protein N)
LYDIQFLFSANKGIALQEMSKAASGGEFSRLMFAIKSLLAEKIHLPTIIFDEIDTGISGEIALKMGGLMQVMGQKHQMICITHLPQIAAKGQYHFFVYKDHSGAVSSSNIKQIETQERVSKIAEMIAGNNPGETALQSARELLG